MKVTTNGLSLQDCPRVCVTSRRALVQAVPALAGARESGKAGRWSGPDKEKVDRDESDFINNTVFAFD